LDKDKNLSKLLIFKSIICTCYPEFIGVIFHDDIAEFNWRIFCKNIMTASNY